MSNPLVLRFVLDVAVHDAQALEQAATAVAMERMSPSEWGCMRQGAADDLLMVLHDAPLPEGCEVLEVDVGPSPRSDAAPRSSSGG